MKNYAWILVIAACALCGLPDKSAAAEDTPKS